MPYSIWDEAKESIPDVVKGKTVEIEYYYYENGERRRKNKEVERIDTTDDKSWSKRVFFTDDTYLRKSSGNEVWGFVDTVIVRPLLEIKVKN